MLVRSLIGALERSKTLRGVQLTTWALERVTGFKTHDLIHKSEYSSESFGTVVNAEWYGSNGYHRLASALGGHSSYAGRAVTLEAAIESAAVYACVKIISEDVGTLPFNLYEQSEDGKAVEKAYGHPLFRVLHDMANPETSAGEFREALTAHTALGCDGFAKIERNSNGDVVFLYQYQPGQVRMERNSMGQLFYVVKEGSVDRQYARDEIFHLKGFTLDGSRGDDILRRARHAIGIGLAAQEYAGRFFSQDASAGVILQRPLGAPSLGPEATEKVKEAWVKWHRGLGKSHEPAVMQDGTEVVRVDPDHQKLQMLESRRYQVEETARIYRMPLHKLADLTRSTNNNIEHQGIEYTSNTLAPVNRRWRDAVYRCLLRPEERYWRSGLPRMYAEINVEALLRGSFKTQTDGFKALLQEGVYSPNEVRRWLNLNPFDGGDERHIQSNMATVQQIAEGLVDADAPSTDSPGGIQ